MNDHEIISMLHNIREKHYEQTKGLTPQELIRKTREEAKAVENQLVELRRKKQNA